MRLFVGRLSDYLTDYIVLNIRMKPSSILGYLIAACALLCSPAYSEKPAKRVPSGDMQMDTKQYEANIIKVYSVKLESGSIYNSYVVKWNDSEVVVPDVFGGETKKVGDKITFMVQEIEFPNFGGEKKQGSEKFIQFILMPEFDLDE